MTVASTVLAKENGTEDCDATEAEGNIFKKIMDDQANKLEDAIQNFEEYINDGRDEYDESVRRFWAKSGQPMPK